MTRYAPRHTTNDSTHDALLIAAYAAGDLEPADHRRAAGLVEACDACAALASDLRAIARATARLPVGVRPREFALEQVDADRLRPSVWRRLLAALGAPRAITAPLATTLTTLGLAGLLVSAAPSFGLAGSLETVGRGGDAGLGPGAASPTSAPIVRDGTGYPPSMPEPTARPDVQFGGEPPPRDTSGGEGRNPDNPDLDVFLSDPSPSATLAVLSGSFVIIGLGLFGLVWTGRRFGSG